MMTKNRRFRMWTACVILTAGSSLTAQAGEVGQSASGIAIDEAAIMRHVLGDPSAARRRLQKGLEGASTDQEPRILAELALLYEGMQQTAERQQTLARLAKLSGPYAHWALKKLATAGSTTLQDSLEDWVRGLDSEKRSIVAHARAELDKLGVLAVPEVIRQLPSFTPAGLRNGIRFIVPFAGENVAEVMRSMLSSGEPIRETVASERIKDLPKTMLVELARLALKSKAEIVQVRAAVALLDVDKSTALGVLDRLSRSRSYMVREGVLLACSHPAAESSAVVDRIIDRFVAGSDEVLAVRAQDLWLRRNGTADAQKSRAWITKLPPERVRAVVKTLLRGHDANPQLLVEGLRFPDLVVEVLQRVSQQDLVGHEDLLLGALKAVPVDFNQDYGRGQRDSLYAALGSLRVRAALPFLTDVVGSSNYGLSQQAWLAIRLIDAKFLMAQYKYLQDSRWIDPYLSLLRVEAGPEEMQYIVRAVRVVLGDPGQSVHSRVNIRTQAGSIGAGQKELLRTLLAFGARSDVSNLPEALALVPVPEQSLKSLWCYGARREAVLEALKRWFGAAHVGPALESIWSVDAAVGLWMLDASKPHVGREHLDALIKLLSSAKQKMLRPKSEKNLETPHHAAAFEVASRVLSLLGMIDHERARAVMIASLDDPKLASRALVALRDGSISDQKIWLRKVLSEKSQRALVGEIIGQPIVAKDAELRKLAITVMAEARLVADGAKRFFEELNSDERLALAHAILQHHREKAVSQMLVQVALVELGGRRSEGLVDDLALGLESRSQATRAVAVDQLLRTYSRKIVPHLLEALKDDEESVRFRAESALARLDKYYESVKKWEGRLLKSGK